VQAGWVTGSFPVYFEENNSAGGLLATEQQQQQQQTVEPRVARSDGKQVNYLYCGDIPIYGSSGHLGVAMREELGSDLGRDIGYICSRF
jgi:precorrin-2 methylase